MAGIPAETPKTRVPLPPTNARVVTMACEYCPVACGYKAYIWPVGAEGDLRAAENALNVDFPAPALSGRWPSPNMHTNVTIVGQLQNVLVMPDPDADAVNVGGNHSVSGGTLALKLYRPDGPTRDRLQRPLLRVNGTLQPIAWEAATDIVAEMIRYTIDEFGELAMGFKSARTGVPAESIRRAAELLARPVDGVTPKASLLYEKGLYWTHNYENTAAMGARRGGAGDGEARVLVPPTKYEEFARQYPDVLAAYERLGATTHDGGPLDARTRELVKLALAVGAGLESAAHVHTRLALEVGALPADVRHVALLAATTLGFPSGSGWSVLERA